MSITVSRYFHIASLRQRYIDELDQAMQLLQAEERMWLQTLTRLPVAGQTDPVRVDRLTCGADSPPPFELATALLLSHGQNHDPRVYLFTLSRGIERFSNRAALLNTLRARFAAGDPSALFEAEQIEGDPFRAQMLAIVDHQVAQIRQITEQLGLTPSLLQASSASLLKHMRVTMPHMAVDPATHLLQIVPTSINDDSLIPTTQTLAEAAFDDCCNVQLAHGFERRFLDARGQQASAEDATLFAKVLSDTKATLAEPYRNLLNAFWSGAGQGQGTRRELAIERFGDNLRGAFQARRHCADLGRVHLQMLQEITGDLRITPAPHCKRLTIKVGESASCPLAGTFVMQLENDPSLLWFAPDQKLVSFDDVQVMGVYFATPEGRERLRPALALEDQPSIAKEGRLQIDLQQILAPLCADRVDSIIAAQTRNLQYALTLHRTPEAATAMIDDALDVRLLLDPLQLSIADGRWRKAAPFNFADVWLKSAAVASVPGVASVPASADIETLGTESASTSDTGRPPRAWRQQTLNFDERAERLRGLDAVFLDSAEQALQPYMWMLTSDTVRARNVHVQWLESASVDVSHVETHAVAVSESQRLVSVDLVSLLLECVSEFRTPVLPASARVMVGSVSARHPAIDLVRHMLSRVTPVFLDQYLRRFEQSRVGFWRQGDRQVRPGREEIALRVDAMRLDLMLARRGARIGGPALDMVRQVLERPLRSMRLMLDRPVTEACSVWLTFSGHSVLLCDTLLFSEPTDSRKPIMVWSAVAGWRQVESIALLQDIFEGLLRGAQSECWLGLVTERDRQLLRTYLSQPLSQLRVRLERIEGHAFEALQRDVLNRDQQNLRQLCLRAKRWRFEADLFCRLAQDTELDMSLFNMLDELSLRIENCLFEALLPAWLKSATVEDLKGYLDQVTRYYLESDGGKTFLFGIPPLRAYARNKLIDQLNHDFPDHKLDPDQIMVTSRRYVSAFPAPGELPFSVPAATLEHRESLTEYAINRFVNQQDAVLGIEFTDQEQDARLLTPDSLRRMVRLLDVGASYLTSLRKALAPDDPDYAARKRLFMNQWPPMLLALGLQEKLKGNLSALAYAYISRILDMPDGVAREPLDGVRVMISPLQLVADSGMTPDPASGMYVIGSANADAGSVVLLVIQHSDFTFREYASQHALQEAIRSDQSLQALLLERLDPEVHRRYAHGGFVEPHLPFSVEGIGDVPLRAPGPVTLGLTDMRGNALQYLFKGVLKLLLDQSVSNVVTNLQFDQAGRMFLATLGFEQLFSLLPNKLATLATLWQSETLFRASVASASGRHWGEALSEFSAALGVMVAAREQALEDQNVDSVRVDGEQRTTSTSAWGVDSLTAEQRVRLQGLEAQNVALEQMRRDDLLNLYLDSAHNTPYAVVDGRVYQVRQTGDEGQWSIVGADGAPGPQLVLDTDQRWQLDLSLRLRGGGGRVGKVRSQSAEHAAAESLIIEASGMHEIRLRYRDRARRIVQAHLKARLYLENALDNLNVNRHEAALDPRVSQVVADFFGVDAPGQPLLDRVEGALKALFDAMMDPSLAPFSSPRYVVGSNRPGHEMVTAFVIKGDPERRVFLTEHFFHSSQFALSPLAMAQGFESSIHHRSAILLHELSHQILDTYDIAYLECMAPYPDLLLENNAKSVQIKAFVERLHDYRLSHRAEAASLFKVKENGAWRDLTLKDDRGVKGILDITETTNLNDARHVFLNDADKRSRVMLTNADSLVLLILRLGRHNYAATNP